MRSGSPTASPGKGWNWLDFHDPPCDRPLNIHTSSSAASKWMPYEFACAKDRPLRSTHGGGLNMWLQNRNAGERILGPTRPLLR
jgi:hypothetical protein